MKKYHLSFADSTSHKPEHPERTARKSGFSSLDMDVHYRVWPSREGMARSIRMQQKRAPKSTDWRACVKLADHEGH